MRDLGGGGGGGGRGCGGGGGGILRSIASPDCGLEIIIYEKGGGGSSGCPAIVVFVTEVVPPSPVRPRSCSCDAILICEEYFFILDMYGMVVLGVDL